MTPALSPVVAGKYKLALSVMLVFVKLPLPSRFTTVFGVAALVGVCPPTFATTVALCVPVTSPESEPEKLERFHQLCSVLGV
jgi:hypothetical protein